MTREEILQYKRDWAKRYRLAHPEKIKAAKKAYAQTEQGKAQAKAAGARFRAAHPDYERARHSQYGNTFRGKASAYLVKARGPIGGGCTSTLDEAEWWMRNKPELCQCCSKEPAKHLDHKHGGPIRGWTCHTCNIHLGVIEKDGFLEIALRYLDKTKKKD